MWYFIQLSHSTGSISSHCILWQGRLSCFAKKMDNDILFVHQYLFEMKRFAVFKFLTFLIFFLNIPLFFCKLIIKWLAEYFLGLLTDYLVVGSETLISVNKRNILFRRGILPGSEETKENLGLFLKSLSLHWAINSCQEYKFPSINYKCHLRVFHCQL